VSDDIKHTVETLKGLIHEAEQTTAETEKLIAHMDDRLEVSSHAYRSPRRPTRRNKPK
jgi:hypothetical protein